MKDVGAFTALAESAKQCTELGEAWMRLRVRGKAARMLDGSCCSPVRFYLTPKGPLGLRNIKTSMEP